MRTTLSTLDYKQMLFSGTICATMAVILSLTSTAIDNDKIDKYDSIGNASTFNVKEIDSICVGPQYRLPQKDGSDSTTLHVSNVLV